MHLMIFANQAALAIAEFDRRTKVDNSYYDMVGVLAETVDSSDPYTFGHSKAVRDYSVGIAEQLGWEVSRTQRLSIAGYLHDLGKIGIPDAIMKKTAKLTDDEYALVKTHPKISGRILRPVDFFSDIIPTIEHHHEKYDGSGYPGQLRGNQIPLGARIMAVADAFDAMSSKRAYRKLLTTDEILAELALGRGTQFDPQVLDAFMERFDVNRRTYRAGENPLRVVIQAEKMDYFRLAAISDEDVVEVQKFIIEIGSIFLKLLLKYAGPDFTAKICQKINMYSTENRLDFQMEKGAFKVLSVKKQMPIESVKMFQAYLDYLLTITKSSLSLAVVESLTQEMRLSIDGETLEFMNNILEGTHYAEDFSLINTAEAA